ncbi:MAG: flagellar hook-associated protein FlgK [Hyphomicrobiales bacterium]|nr:flagellar hook-associated protein FlgK [Hyphomicrobiales bacterium]
MSLNIATGVANSSLGANSEQIAVLSRNIARAGEANASRKTVNLVTTGDGGVRAASITRASNQALFVNSLTARSAAASHQAITSSLNQLERTINDPELDASPAALIEKLGSDLQQYATTPGDITVAKSTVLTAKKLAVSLNEATSITQAVRKDADAGIAEAVTRVNELLRQFGKANETIVKGVQSGADVTDALDERDSLLASVSELIGVRPLNRAGGDMALYTDGGVTLFETTARTVQFTATSMFTAGIQGGSVTIDGVPVTGSSAAMPISSGKIYGLTQVRDDYAVSYQRQLDETARALVDIFRETDQSATPLLADATGLFTYSGAPAIPGTGTIVNGVAASIAVNPAVDPDLGGSAKLLRDSGVNGAAYVYNATSASGFSDRLLTLSDALGANRPFDAVAGLETSANVRGFSASSVAWLSEARKTASEDMDYSETMMQRSGEALSSATGVNIDQEMTRMLEVERSYAASAKLIAAIDGMFETLLAAAG